jgi:hypothetical protein
VRLDHYVPFSLTFQPWLKDMEIAKAVGPALAGKTGAVQIQARVDLPAGVDPDTATAAIDSGDPHDAQS